MHVKERPQPKQSRFRVLTRIDDETRSRGATADEQRLSMMNTAPTTSTYRAFLLRVYGFEGPVEAALHMTRGLTDIIDLRARLHTRLLRSDAAALGVVDLTRSPRCPNIPRFADVLEALGWMYVIERGRMLNSILHRYLEERLSEVVLAAATYLRSERSAGTRMRELGDTLDSVVQSDADVDRVLVAAHGAFRAQAQWYTEAQPPGRLVA
jgi:heme oxygenase